MADIVRRFGRSFLDQHASSLSAQQKRALIDILCCRTWAMGGHCYQCQDCGHERLTCNSCRNRHCPKCQGSARVAWAEQQADELLPVKYFHVVFTLPQAIARLALQNKSALYNMLFQAATDTLQTLAADPKHLGAQLGILSVLHTWGQQLAFHPHLHCLVTAGGLSLDGSHWVACRGSEQNPFLFPVKVMSSVFRGKFLSLLRRAVAAGKVQFLGELAALAQPANFEKYLTGAANSAWVVYAKPPLAQSTVVVKYLARYTHRVAISNQRLVDIQGNNVRFHWKDYRDGDRCKTATMDGGEFLRRFLLHVLPKGFVRIRHYGLVANRKKHDQLHRCRELLGVAPPPEVKATAQGDQLPPPVSDRGVVDLCPACQSARFVAVDHRARRPVIDRAHVLHDL